MQGLNVLSLFDGMSAGRIALERAGIKVQNYFASEIDKHAIKVSQDNYPDIIQLGDVSKIDVKNLPKIDLLIGGSPCFVAGTGVITSSGIKPIESVLVGDEVLTHTNHWKKVVRVGGQISPNTYTIKAQGICETTTTPEHPYYVRTMKRVYKNRVNVRTFSEPRWKPARELTKGDYIGIPIIQDQENSLEITPQEAFVLGRYIADGHTRKDFRTSEGRPNDRLWQLILSIGSHKLDDFKGVVHSGYSCYPHTQSVHRVVFSSKRLVEIAEMYCGCGASNKGIHPRLLKLPTNILSSLVEGILSGDGSQRGKEIRLTTVSKQLIDSLQLAIAKVYGVVGNVYFCKRPRTCVIEGRTVNQKDTYTISFQKEVQKQSHYRVIDGHVWVPVKSVTNLGNPEKVFNLEVDVDNSYTANNAVVHNCQGFSLAGKQIAFDDPRSKLYFEYERILNELKVINPNIKFLLENVKMKQEFKDVITTRLGVEPIAINSNLVSAQNRYRLYWTNIKGVAQPEDLGIYLKDIIEHDVNDKFFIKAKRLKWLKEKDGYSPSKAKCLTVRSEPSWNTTYLVQPVREVGRRLDANGVRCDSDKSVPITRRYEVGTSGKSNCITTVQKDSFVIQWPSTSLLLNEGLVRKLTPVECERLQTVPDGYTSAVSDTQRYKMLGNGWTVDVIAHIFRGLHENTEELEVQELGMVY